MKSAASFPFAAHSEKDRIPVVRETQRDWIKHRDAGAKLYKESGGKSTADRRYPSRLYLLCR